MRGRQDATRGRCQGWLVAAALGFSALAACAQLSPAAAGARNPAPGPAATVAGQSPPGASAQPWQVAPSGGLVRPLMPDRSLEPPANFAPVLYAYAQGVQRYVCKPADQPAGSFAWTLKEPQAKLFDAADHEIGTHSAGPTWQLRDGSKVIKKRVVGTFRALELDGVPWLLVEVEPSGSGMLSQVQFVQRIDTVGGAAPAAGCDAGHAGTEHDVDYRATYIFYTPRAPK
jgi:Protein of unknown function (DUF3455)